MNAVQALSALIPTGYLITAMLYARARNEARERSARWVLRSVLALHVAYFVALGLRLRTVPLVDTWTVVSAVALAVALAWSLVARGVRHSGSGGIVLLVVTALQLAASACADPAPAVSAHPLTPLTTVHAGMNVLAIAALVLSGLHGALYVLLHRQMRRRRFGAFFARLPDLELLASMTRRAALLGFVGLTLGLNLGIGMAHAMGQPGFHYTSAEVLVPLVLWVHFGVVAFSRFIPGLGARRASFAAAGGLVLLLASLVFLVLPRHLSGGA